MTEIVEVTFHGRGGQTSITASQLLAEFAYEKGFKDTIAIPIIGAERRGAPVLAYTKISRERPIRTYDSVKDPDYILIFDTSLLDIQSVRDSIKEGVTLLADSVKPLDRSIFMHSSGPILNIPMLGAFGKITGYYDLDIMEKVLKKEFGEKKIDKNMSVARDAYETVKEV